MLAISGLFVYGSLTFPEVLDAVLGRVPRSRRAQAEGWRAAALRERPFPGLVAADAPATVGGLLLTDLTGEESAMADAFEGPMYSKVAIGLDDGTRALTYVCVDDSLALAHDWDRAAFQERELERYLDRCAAWKTIWTAGWNAGWNARRER